MSTSENITFLKNLYGLSGSSHTVKGSGVGFDSSGKGITLYRGYEADEIEILLKWNTIEKRLKELIKFGPLSKPKRNGVLSNVARRTHENSQREEYEDDNVLEQEEQNDTENSRRTT